MNLISSTVLAIVQGITEFLPVSSSGHLTLAQHLLHLSPSLSLDIVLNTATLLSVLIFFKKQTSYFFANLKYIIIGTIPATIIGLIFKPHIEILFGSTTYLPYFFLITSLLLFSTKFTSSSKNNTNLTITKAFVIGLFQALAILPAVSRSGATISSALLLGLSPLQAFSFSFALFIPASVGALILDSKNIFTLFSTVNTSLLIYSFVLTFIVGLVALKALQSLLIKRKIWYFAIYTTIISLVLLALTFTGSII